MDTGEAFVEGKLNQKSIVVFSKSSLPIGKLCRSLLALYEGLSEDRYEWINIDKRLDSHEIERYVKSLAGAQGQTLPLFFINGQCIGGYRNIIAFHEEGHLQYLLSNLSLEPKDQLGLPEHEAADERPDLCVRIDELEETELVVRVADWISKVPVQQVDYDAFWERDSMLSLEAIMSVWPEIRDESPRAGQSPRELEVEAVDSNMSQPEWIYVGGTKKHRENSVDQMDSTTQAGASTYRMRSKSEPITKLPKTAGTTTSRRRESAV